MSLYAHHMHIPLADPNNNVIVFRPYDYTENAVLHSTFTFRHLMSLFRFGIFNGYDNHPNMYSRTHANPIKAYYCMLSLPISSCLMPHTHIPCLCLYLFNFVQTRTDPQRYCTILKLAHLMFISYSHTICSNMYIC